MAGDWIKMRADLGTHPKVVRMASALNADRLRVIGGLHAVWCLFDMHSEDGKLYGYTLSAVDDLIGWPHFAQAMHGVEWLEVSNDYLCAPRFDAHNGQSAKRRATESERKRQERILSASEADILRTREEKRREEKKEPSGSLRATKKCPSSFQITEAMQVWAMAECPQVDLKTETDKLRDHEFKTARKDWSGTWRNWMRKAQQDAKSMPQGNGTAYSRHMDQRASELAPGVARKPAQTIILENEHVSILPSH